MAKKAKRGRPKGSGSKGPAQSFGAALGGVAAKVDSWMGQRAEIAGELRKLIGSAQGMLASMGEAGTDAVTAVTALALSKAGVGGKKARKPMSAEAKAKIAAAQRKRWAAQKAEPAAAAKKAKRVKKAGEVRNG